MLWAIIGILGVHPIYAASYFDTAPIPAQYKPLLRAICWVESRHNPKAFRLEDGGTPSIGICQIKLGTARFMGFKGTMSQLQQPHTNVKFAAKYLLHQLVRYRLCVRKAVKAYNRGTFKGSENCRYVREVLKAEREHR